MLRLKSFDYCHNRPRDILIYVSHAIDLAKERRHPTIQLEDVDGARRRFSDNRFKDLGDEYAENYPQIALVLNRFYGLGRRFTPGGIESFIRKLLSDREIIDLCGGWIFEYQQMEQFVRLLYNIGFIGLRRPGQETRFRALGPQETSPPAVTDADEIEVHKSSLVVLAPIRSGRLASVPPGVISRADTGSASTPGTTSTGA